MNWISNSFRFYVLTAVHIHSSFILVQSQFMSLLDSKINLPSLLFDLFSPEEGSSKFIRNVKNVYHFNCWETQKTLQLLTMSAQQSRSLVANTRSPGQ
jgi:hypothetical protein